MNFLFVIVAIGFICMAQAAPSEENEEKKLHLKRGPPQCLGKNLTLSEEMKAAEKSCVKHPHHHHLHKHRNVTCQMVCKYQAFGLISADNKVNNDKIEGFVKQVFPESVTVTLTKDMTTCAEKNGANLSIKDGKCKSYKPLFECIHKAVKENCKIEGDSKAECNL